MRAIEVSNFQTQELLPVPPLRRSESVELRAAYVPVTERYLRRYPIAYPDRSPWITRVTVVSGSSTLRGPIRESVSLAARVVVATVGCKEYSMPKMLITHGVADVAKWLGFKAERAEAIARLGGSNVVDHVAHDGSNMVGLSADVADVDKMMAALGSPPPEIAAAMEKHGVLPPLVAYVEG
jgi:hypothetical protein